jgi:signal transduction histidine kinase
VTRWPHAVRWRLTLWYAATLGAGLLVFAVASLVLLREVLERRSDRFLGEARSAFVAELAVELRELPTREAAVQAAIDEVRFEDTRFLVYDSAARLLAATPSPIGAAASASARPVPELDARRLGALVAPGASAAHTSEGSPGVALRTLPDSEGGYRVAVGDVVLDGQRYGVVAAHARHGLVETLEFVAAAYALAIPLLLGLAGAGGYVLARRALAPVAAMSERAREIGATTLHGRLPVANPRDELGSLAGVVNELLGRLEGAFTQQRRFVADASHELRTPVAILRAEADVALGRSGRSEAEYREAIGVMRDAAQRLSRIVDDLFLLARADSGHQTVRRAPLYLDELVADGVRAMCSVAARRDVRLTVDMVHGAPDGMPFTGDPELLDRLLLNLLDNAVRFSPAAGEVRVRLASGDDAYQLSVADDGPGIPPEARPHVFDRFFRVDRARSRGEALHTATPDGLEQPIAPSGAGLGLAIARWIAEAHGGSLVLARSTSDGTTFVATLPRARMATGDAERPAPAGSEAPTSNVGRA